jgi:hypothetical protein
MLGAVYLFSYKFLKIINARIAYFLQLIVGWSRFWISYNRYNKLLESNDKLDLKLLYPCIHDNVDKTEIEPIYFYQDAWAFARIIANNPSLHIDIGSNHKFVSLLSTVVKTVMIDIRPLSLALDTIEFKHGTITNLPYANGEIISLSSLCVVEHIGLGRYGDELDPMGSVKAMSELQRVLANGGSLYISLPVSNVSKTCFNAHRYFTEEYVKSVFKCCELVDSMYIYKSNVIYVNPNRNCVACYHFIKNQM